MNHWLKDVALALSAFGIILAVAVVLMAAAENAGWLR